MLTVGKKQMRDLSQMMRRSLLIELATAQVAPFRDKPWIQAPGNCRKLIESAVDRAAQYGVVKPKDVIAFVKLEAELGFDFERDTARRRMLDILTNPRLSGTQKIDALLECMVFRA